VNTEDAFPMAFNIIETTARRVKVGTYQYRPETCDRTKQRVQRSWAESKSIIGARQIIIDVTSARKYPNCRIKERSQRYMGKKKEVCASGATYMEPSHRVHLDD